MAKGKSIPYVWVCGETNAINGGGKVAKEKIKDMVRMKYSPRLRVRTEHKAKAVKKGGTRALANAK